MEERQQEQYWINSVKSIGVLLVVVGHVVQLLGGIHGWDGFWGSVFFAI